MSDLTHAELRRIIAYNPDTGAFIWKVRTSSRARAGTAAGSLAKTGYIVIKYQGAYYKAHRLAWFYIHGEWPAQQIDHINGVRTDNRICNLRDVAPRVNLQNMHKFPSNRTGLLGVFPMPSGNFAAKIRLNGKVVYIGTYSTALEAHTAYISVKREAHEGCTL